MEGMIHSAMNVVQDVLNELRIDIRDIVDLVFEQFGIDNFWEQVEESTNHIRLILYSSSRHVGCRRSIVRLIGSRLPFNPVRRPYFRLVKDGTGYGKDKLSFKKDVQLVPFSEDAVFVYNAVDNWDFNMSVDINRSASASNDAVYLLQDSFTASTPKRCSLEHISMPSLTLSATKESDFNGCHQANMNELLAGEMLAFKEQLAELRMELATIVLAKDDSSVSKVNSHTGLCVRRHSHLAPPPPPPLPSTPLFAPECHSLKVCRQIRNKAPLISTPSSQLNMLDVLKDIGNVKLKHVERSPGGTPLRRRPKLDDPNDPAAIITAALKKRFAHMEPLQEADKENYDNDSLWDCSSNCSSPLIKAY